MEDPTVATFASSQKRPREDDVEPLISTPTKAPASDACSTPLTVLSTVPSPSPARNISSQSPISRKTSVSGTSPAPARNAIASIGHQQPAKRRKLTPQEKEDLQKEKEAKEKARADRKAQKEADDKVKAEQKAQREEQKRLKDEEKRKKNEEREEKKRAKDFELQKKEEEKRKKEQSQMRLNAFFSKKPATDISSSAPVIATQSSIPDLISSAHELAVVDVDSEPVSPQKAKESLDKGKTDYERFFLPFQVHAHTILAPINRYISEPTKVAAAQSRLDNILSGKEVDLDSPTLESIKAQFGASEPRGTETPSVLEIVERINGSSDNPIDLTSDRGPKALPPLEMMKQIPMKYLRFGEDVRPPYYGTYTKPYTPREARKLALNPLSRLRPDTDYDYDSEAEWEEPEEGEELNSDGDEDLDDEGEDDMEGFLDDEGDPQVKRRLISGDLEPISTGLCWEDVRGVSKLNDGSNAISTEFNEFKIGFLLEPLPQSIDPFSKAYWTSAPTAPGAIGSAGKLNTINGIMQPPRMPLTQRPVNGMMNTLNPPSTTSSATTAKLAKAPKRLIPAEHLPAFKAEVEGSDLTKLALIEALKKKFPKVPKDAISNTLSTVAARVGAKEVEKRWVLHTN